jgi:hypothetical protein
LRPSRLYAHLRTHDWCAVTIDFVIVVLGVYVAVWAADRQSAHERDERTGKVVAALRQDLRDSIAVEQKFDQALDPALAAFTAARERGETPPPVFYAFQAPTRRRGAPAWAFSRRRSQK